MYTSTIIQNSLTGIHLLTHTRRFRLTIGVVYFTFLFIFFIYFVASDRPVDSGDPAENMTTVPPSEIYIVTFL